MLFGVHPSRTFHGSFWGLARSAQSSPQTLKAISTWLLSGRDITARWHAFVARLDGGTMVATRGLGDTVNTALKLVMVLQKKNGNICLRVDWNGGMLFPSPSTIFEASYSVINGFRKAGLPRHGNSWAPRNHARQSPAARSWNSA